MRRVLLFGTDHDEKGKCNADELYTILLEIRPDIIFNEIPTSMFSAIMEEHKFFDSLEVRGVRKYLEKDPARHIPVDIAEHDKTIIDYDENEITDSNIVSLQKRLDQMIAGKGFSWLNSKEHDTLIEEKYALHKKYFSGKAPNLVEQYEKSDTYHFETREKIFLENIYGYAEEYDNGILLTGADHRPTLISKIEKLKKDHKIDWEYYYGERSKVCP
jgi:hypothetical protein